MAIFNALEDFYKVAVVNVRDIDTIGVPDCFVQMFVRFLRVKVPQGRFVRYKTVAIVHIQHSREEIVGDVIEGADSFRGSKFNRQTGAGPR